MSHEHGDLMNGISTLKKETPENYLILSTMSWHSKKITVYKPRSWSSPDTKYAGALILDFLAAGTMRNKFLVIDHPVSSILL